MGIGMDLLRVVRSTPIPFRNIAFVITTGQPDELRRGRILEAGGQGLLAKPCTRDGIATLIASIPAS